MSRHASHQKLARVFGATDIVTERGDAGVARIKELTNGLGADSVLECVVTSWWCCRVAPRNQRSPGPIAPCWCCSPAAFVPGAATGCIYSQYSLDQLLTLNERHLLHVLIAYTTFYNERRPHQGLGQACPVPLAASPGAGPIQRRDVLGGILHDYYRTAA